MTKVKNEKIREKSAVAIIIGIAVVIVLAIIAVVAINANRMGPIDDSYFVSDDTKLVLNVDGSMVSVSEGEQRPVASHMVYYYSGDKINNVKIFFEYVDEEQAKVADEVMGDSYKEWAESKNLNGKYVVFQLKRSQYENMKTDEARQIIESLESVTGM